MSTTDPHKKPARTFRPNITEYDRAVRALRKRKITMTDFLRACLRWVKADPDGALAVLAPHWPPPRRRGAAAHTRPPAKP